MESGTEFAGVHGYDSKPPKILGPFNARVCEEIVRVQQGYKKFLLLPGQNLHGVEAYVDQIMKEALLKEYRVPEEKISAWSDELPEYRPPRDTIEEVDLLAVWLRKLGHRPRETPFGAIGLRVHGPRIRLIYKHRGAKLQRFHGAPAWSIHRVVAVEIPAYSVTWLSLEHNNKIAQSIIRNNRAGRNVFPTRRDGQPWIDVSPNAWDD